MEVEDDVFFADLSRQISLLLLDDEEDPIKSYSSTSLQVLTQASYPTAPAPLLSYGQTCRRESKGTGVFIPQSPMLRRKNRQGRYTSFNNKSHGQPGKSREASNVKNTDNPSCNYYSYKKF